MHMSYFAVLHVEIDKYTTQKIKTNVERSKRNEKEERKKIMQLAFDIIWH